MKNKKVYFCNLSFAICVDWHAVLIFSIFSSYTCICDLEGLCMRHLWRPGKGVGVVLHMGRKVWV